MIEKEDEIRCPSCRNSVHVRPSDSEVQCKVCSDTILLAGHLCPDCSTYHENDEFLCRNCGSTLSRICQNCRQVNWPGHEFCTSCSELLDLFSQIATQKERSTSQRLQEHMRDAAGIKQLEETASANRMSKMLAIEERRQTEIRKQQAKRKQGERRMFIIVGAAIGFFLLVALVLVILGSLS